MEADDVVAEIGLSAQNQIIALGSCTWGSAA